MSNSYTTSTPDTKHNPILVIFKVYHCVELKNITESSDVPSTHLKKRRKHDCDLTVLENKADATDAQAGRHCFNGFLKALMKQCALIVSEFIRTFALSTCSMTNAYIKSLTVSNFNVSKG